MPEVGAVGCHLGAVKSETPPVPSQSFPVLKDCRPKRLRFLPVLSLIGAAAGAGFALCRRVLRSQDCRAGPACQRRHGNSAQDPSSNTVDHALPRVSETPVMKKSCARPAVETFRRNVAVLETALLHVAERQ